MKKSILVMTYGSPESYDFDGICEFFTNIRRGKRPNDGEINLLLENYLKIKQSPLQEITKKEKCRFGLNTMPLFHERSTYRPLRTSSSDVVKFCRSYLPPKLKSKYLPIEKRSFKEMWILLPLIFLGTHLRERRVSM